MVKKVKRQPKRKFDQPDRYYTKSGNRCLVINLDFTVDKRHIIAAIMELLNYDGTESKDKKYKITIPNVRRRLFNCLRTEGTNWLEKIELSEEYESNRWNCAEAFAKEIFPIYFDNKHGNSVDYILKPD